jgi:hypothetical protein
MSTRDTALQTLGRLPGAWSITAGRSRCIYVACNTAGGMRRVLRVNSTGEVDVLPMLWPGKDWSTVVVSPNEDAIYVGTQEGKLLVQYAPWPDGPPKVLLEGMGYVKQVRVCQEGYVQRVDSQSHHHSCTSHWLMAQAGHKQLLMVVPRDAERVACHANGITLHTYTHICLRMCRLCFLSMDAVKYVHLGTQKVQV